MRESEIKPLQSPTLVVLAAGMGSRYGGLKQIDPVGPRGETIIDYSVFDAIRAGFGKLVFIIRKDIERQFKETVGARFEKHIPVEYVFQELDSLPPQFSVPAGRVKPWGTTHAVLMAANAIREPFAVINADDFYGLESFRILSAHLQSVTRDYAMVGFVLCNTLSAFGTVARGVCEVDGEGFLESVTELTGIERKDSYVTSISASGQPNRLTGDEIVSMNMWGFTPAVFAQLKTFFEAFLMQHGAELKSECYLPSAINEFVESAQARVRVLHTGASWFGVTYREDHPRVVESITQLIESGCYPGKLWA
jgi:NDP-sugar pyrophosphorylase family protein